MACGALGALATFLPQPAAAQHSQTSAVAVNPNDPDEVWTLNRDNGSVAIVDVVAGALKSEIAVGRKPRTLAFTPDGTRVFVANQRGNVPFDRNFVSPFLGTEKRGTVSVIDTQTLNVQEVFPVGTEPFGVAVAPNGKYFAVTGFRSGTVKFFDVQTLAEKVSHQYLVNMQFIPDPFTIADVDSNLDGIPDLGDPRGFVIRSDSTRLYVTHHKSPFISILDVTLDASGLPTAATLTGKIDTNQYPFDPFFNPTLVQNLKSQGMPRFLEDIALSPNGAHAVVPHVLHNVNHDVNTSFPGLAGDFANRVYPAVTVIDAVANSFGQAGDNSSRLHHELSDPLAPAEYVPFGGNTAPNGGTIMSLGGTGSPVLGGQATFVVDGVQPGETAHVWIGRRKTIPLGAAGVLYVRPRFMFHVVGGQVTVNIPNSPALEGEVLHAQAVITLGGAIQRVSNGLDVVLGSAGFGSGKMGYRAGHPSRVRFNTAGDHVLMLNRGSEDLFLYELKGNSLELRTVFPPRHGFKERSPLDTSSPMGDLPLGMLVVPDPNTTNDDALVYVVNELTRTLSVLRVNYDTGTIVREKRQISIHSGADIFSPSVRLGNELFEDASRAQTAGNFNNSCASCHFEGGEDSSVWQRGDGPRSTMPVYGGSLLTGLILWRGVRLNMGETGPMFGGENGGHGIMNNVQQQALVDYHATIPVPLNPHLDPVTGQYSQEAELGRDLYFGLNDTGLNPNLRHAGCAECHPDNEGGAARGYTADFLDPQLTSGENLETFDPDCFSLQGNIVALNVRNVNSGANIDFDMNGVPDPDRNSDGYIDVETYPVMNWDSKSDFTRDDPNSYLCPSDPSNPSSPLKIFQRDMRHFSIPTKLGVFSSGPYFHDHSAQTLRAVVDPEVQEFSPKYGTPALQGQASYPGLNKFFNEFHDLRGHQEFVSNASKVQLNLQSTDVQADIEAILAYIQAL